jgi:hypothetical protein
VRSARPAKVFTRSPDEWVFLVEKPSTGDLTVSDHRHADQRQPTPSALLKQALGTPTTLEDTLDVFERRGGPRARQAARRYLGGDMSTAATDAWERHALPLYGGANADGDLTVRRQRALINDDVQTHFRLGRCGPSDAAAYVGTIACPTLILAGLDDPVSPAVGAAALAAAITNADVRLETFSGVGTRRLPSRSDPGVHVPPGVPQQPRLCHVTHRPTGRQPHQDAVRSAADWHGRADWITNAYPTWGHERATLPSRHR